MSAASPPSAAGDRACLANLLGDTERAAFERDGFLVLRGALERELLADLRALAATGSAPMSGRAPSHPDGRVLER
jgi:hypothetical protein